MTQTLSFGERLRAYRKLQRMPQHELAKLLGVGQPTISDWESGRYSPPVAKMQEIAEQLGLAASNPSAGGASAWLAGALGDVISVPEYDVTVAAGDGAVITDSDPIGSWPFPRRFLDSTGRTPASFVVVTVSGDSMQPTLRSGDKLLIDTSRTRASLPGIYVLAVGDMAVVKRLETIPGSRPERVRISSDNPLHQSYEAPETDIRILGWAAAVIARL